jgi:N-acyl-D-aspartate/D-glutamate deacylase
LHCEERKAGTVSSDHALDGGANQLVAERVQEARLVHRAQRRGHQVLEHAGTLRPGSRADLAVINPVGLDDADGRYAEAAMPEFGSLSRMVNRSGRAVEATVVGGHVVYGGGEFAEGFGTDRRAGRFLRARPSG